MAPICKLNRFKMLQEYARINSGIFLHIPAYAKHTQETRGALGICNHVEMCRNMVEVLSELHHFLYGTSWGHILRGYYVRRCKQHTQLALRAARHSEPWGGHWGVRSFTLVMPTDCSRFHFILFYSVPLTPSPLGFPWIYIYIYIHIYIYTYIHMCICMYIQENPHGDGVRGTDSN